MSNSGFALLILVIVVVTIMRLNAYQGESMTVEELHRVLASTPSSTATPGNILLVDVREPDEFRQGHVANAVNIPLGQINARVDELRGRQPVYVICRSGARSAAACTALHKAEPTLPVVNITGGMNAWQGAGYPVVR